MTWLWPLAILAVAAAACGSNADPTTIRSGEVSPVVVFAASSLSTAFLEIERDFEQAHPEFDLQLNLAGSSSLREQLLEGAPADVFAPADESNMEAIVDADLIVAAPPAGRVFARNQMAIAVPVGNEAGVTSLWDFADSDLLLGLCAEAVPCGQFARQVLANAGIEPQPDTNEPDARALLTKIEAGELDAGIVYQSDVLGNEVEAIPIPDVDNVEARYPVAPLSGSPNPDGAESFIAYLIGPDGLAILAEHGFLTP